MITQVTQIITQNDYSDIADKSADDYADEEKKM